MTTKKELVNTLITKLTIMPSNIKTAIILETLIFVQKHNLVYAYIDDVLKKLLNKK